MVPNTFGGVTLDSLPDKDHSYDYALGYLWNVKQRDSNDFIPMSDALANSAAFNHGAAFGMVKWRPVAGLSTVFMDYNIQDYLNAGFAQAEYDFRMPKGMPNWIVGANLITQQSVGANLLTGNSFRTHQASAKLQMTYKGWTLFAAGSFTGNDSKIFSPFGTKPTYTDMQQVSRLAGTVQTMPFRSISDHLIPRISPDRAAVRMHNSRAIAAGDGWLCSRATKAETLA